MDNFAIDRNGAPPSKTHSSECSLCRRRDARARACEKRGKRRCVRDKFSINNEQKAPARASQSNYAAQRSGLDPMEKRFISAATVQGCWG